MLSRMMSVPLAAVASFCGFAQASFGASTVPSPVDKVFVPLGYDSNDDVEVVLHGTFPDGCWRTGPASGRVDYDTRTVVLKAEAVDPRGGDLECTLALTPFLQKVSLGRVKPGTYTVVVDGRPDAETTPLVVGEASPDDPDDALYAPVDQVSLTQDGAGRNFLTLEGTYPYTLVGCMRLRDVRVSVSPGEVLVVEPLAVLHEEDAECGPHANQEFSVTVPLDHALPAGEYLAHVRAITGSALNALVTVERLDFRDGNE